jgi:hypothetical protein
LRASTTNLTRTRSLDKDKRRCVAESGSLPRRNLTVDGAGNRAAALLHCDFAVWRCAFSAAIA